MNSLIKRKVFILIIVLLLLPLLVGCFLLPPKNQDPIITSVPVTDATVGQVYTYNVEATDPDGDPLTYSLPVAPDGMEISTEGLLSWTPVATGSYEGTVEVSDGKTSITQTFTIVVVESSMPSGPPSSGGETFNDFKKIEYIHEIAKQHLDNIVDSPGINIENTLNILSEYLDEQQFVESTIVNGHLLQINYTSGAISFIFLQDMSYVPIFGGNTGAENTLSTRSNLKTSTTKGLEEKTAIDTLTTQNTKDLNNEIYTGNRDVLIWIPVAAEVNPYGEMEIYDIVSEFENKFTNSTLSFNVEPIENEKADLESLKYITNYDGMVILNTHGYNGEWLQTGEVVPLYTYANMQVIDYLLLQAEGMAIWQRMTVNETGEVVPSEHVYAVNSKWVNTNLSGNFSNTIILNISCESACESAKTDALWSVFESKGAGAYFGFSNIVDATFGWSKAFELIEKLGDGVYTTGETYEEGVHTYVFLSDEKWIATNWMLWGYENLKFPKDTFTITASAGPNGSISPSGEISVNHGSEQSFTITPNIGYIVEDVMVDGSSIGAVDAYTFNNITQNHTISATFSTIETAVDVTYALTVNHALPLQEGILYERWIQLEWENYPEAIGYNIYRSVNQEEYLLIDQTLETAFPGFSDSDVSIGNSYDYYITAYGTNWETAPSEIKHLDTWLPCPYLISPVDNSTITDPNPTFTWDPVGISNFPYGNIYSGSSAFFVHQVIDPDETVCRIDFDDLTTATATYDQDEYAIPLSTGNYYHFNVLAWGFDSSGSLIAKSCSHIWDFYYGEDYVVEFEDSNLEQVVREEINKPEGTLYLSDVIKITSLDAKGRGIISLEGIQHLENLQLFYFTGLVSDISPLANLTNLWYLSMGPNQVSDISPLANMTNLQELYFYYNPVSDISPLANLINLEQLYLADNQVSDISPLANMINLQELVFSYNLVSNISSLANLTNLERLEIQHNQVSDISALSNMTNLERLKFQHNQVSDISPLANLTNLQELLFYFNYVTNVSPLVINSGFGSGDTIDMRNNYLDLTEGSQNMQDIETLISRGVDVEYIPQRTP